MEEVLLTVYVPTSHADVVREFLGKEGAGSIGEYTFCSFSTLGTGRFKPGDKSNPHIGKKNIIEQVPEEKIEVRVEKRILPSILKGLKEVHPYEEPAFHVTNLLNI